MKHGGKLHFFSAIRRYSKFGFDIIREDFAMNNFIGEPARRLPEAGEFDVIVCGGGPAGCAAAVAAARSGAKTLLLERSEYPGGIWTAGLMPWVLDQARKTGQMARWREFLLAHGGSVNRRGSLTAPPEVVKGMLEDDLLASGVKIRYGTLIAAMIRDGRRVTHAVTESRSGREAWRAKLFIDCTGDGDATALAGCGFDFGNEHGDPQPASLNALVGGLDPEEVRPFMVPQGKIPLRELLTSLGAPPSYAMPSLFHFGCGVFGWMTHHAYHVDPADADCVTAAAIAGRAELRKQIAVLRASGGVWRDMVLIATGARLGIREARRIHAAADVTVGDFGKAPVPGRSVCASGMLPDVHGTNPNRCKGVEPQLSELKPQLVIPWLAQVARDCDNLALAGRCIGGDFLCHASYRMTGTAVPLGEAAGIGAAWAARTGKLLAEWNEAPYFGGDAE